MTKIPTNKPDEVMRRALNGEFARQDLVNLHNSDNANARFERKLRTLPVDQSPSMGSK